MTARKSHVAVALMAYLLGCWLLADVQAAVDGGLSKYFNNCMNGRLRDGAPSITGQGGDGITNWMVCTLIYCQRNPGVDGCQWYEDIIGGGVGGVSKYVQELKNFIAIQQLEHTRDQVLQDVMPPPDVEQTEFSGYKAQQIVPLVQDNLAQRNWQMYVWDMFNPQSYKASDYIYEHFSNYCSFFEAEFAKTQQYCAKATVPLPYDMLASTLIGQSVIPAKGTEYLFQQSKGKSKQFFFVTENERAAFIKAYPKAQQYRVYPGVDRQQAALTYIRNATNPVPLAALPDNELFDDKSAFIFNKEKGIPYLEKKYAIVTYLSLARQSLLRMYADRIPDASIKKPNNKVATQSEKTSLLGLIEFESRRRFESADWHKQMNKLPKAAIVREMTNMMALQSTLNYRIMSHLERVEALMAASLAFNAKTIRDAQLASQAGSQAASQ